MTRDPTFGPCIVFGAGGVHAEIIDDFAFRIAPISEADAYAMIHETTVSKILKGVRHQPPADIAAIADVLLRLSQFSCVYPEIGEIDLNPIILGPSGVSIVDARMILSSVTGDDGPPSKRAGP